ncbi:hypothetical protein niasHT_008788 [Heterodera trifolii]|uniref:Peptidase S9A N-terminal domain-containing protein n=1 Tax=Heterodera trifolii TaxID=157864 RepID=A0ABD2M619_9BILA
MDQEPDPAWEIALEKLNKKLFLTGPIRLPDQALLVPESGAIGFRKMTNNTELFCGSAQHALSNCSSTNTDKAQKATNGTEDNNDTGFMSTLKTVAGVAVGALAVQSAFLAGSASRLPSSSGDTEQQQFGDQQRFVSKTLENSRKMPSYKELHANPFGQQNMELAKNDGQMRNGNVMAQFHHHHQRKLTTNSAVAKGKTNPKMETIDPRIYPQAPQGKVTDIYKSANGKKIIVPDPYRDLENANASATKQFVKEINQISQPYLEGSPLRQKLNQTLTKLWNYELFFTPQWHGEYYYYYRNSGLQNQRVLYQTESVAEPGKVFLDPNTLSKDGTIAVTMESFSRDGLLFAYGFSAKGSDSFTVKFKKTTGEELPDQLDAIIYSDFDWLSDGTGVFYSKYPKQSGTEDEFKNHSLYFHKMGTDPKKDILVAQNPEHPYSLTYGQVSEDGRFLFVIVSENSNTQMFYFDLTAVQNKITGKLKLMPLFDKFDADYEIIDSDNDSALVSTNKDAPMNKLVRVSLKGGTKQTPQVVIPEDRTRLMRFAYPVDGNKLLICYMDNVKDALYVHDMKSGKKLYQIPLPFGSVIMDNNLAKKRKTYDRKTAQSGMSLAPTVNVAKSAHVVCTLGALEATFVKKQKQGTNDNGTTNKSNEEIEKSKKEKMELWQRKVVVKAVRIDRRTKANVWVVKMYGFPTTIRAVYYFALFVLTIAQFYSPFTLPPPPPSSHLSAPNFRPIFSEVRGKQWRQLAELRPMNIASTGASEKIGTTFPTTGNTEKEGEFQIGANRIDWKRSKLVKIGTTFRTRGHIAIKDENYRTQTRN